MTAQAQDIRKGRKFDQVVDGARQVFMAHGFEGASVDDIARTAGVSKATLYSYFPDKRLLFLEVCQTECLRQANEAIEFIDLNRPIDEVLRSAADKLISFITSDFNLAIYRMAVAEADRFPELARGFYDSGPKLARTTLISFFEKAVAKGELVVDDYMMAAEQFVELCKAGAFPRMVLGLQDSLGDDERQQIIAAAVKTFLARYGAVKVKESAV
ncbi:TetR/AcrR family transcriptional regulator [Pseudaestuariivita rosea]|uniref:TetR/AcrR family transcriptional regulator n=1 Tax=Pseudaestuariivita rosea TaxID=2763263 RepID=UPI001ABB277F|nr:TetR/AcrR family transcriptional regulator [Pseudaestuariivita rosea]